MSGTILSGVGPLARSCLRIEGHSARRMAPVAGPRWLRPSPLAFPQDGNGIRTLSGPQTRLPRVMEKVLRRSILVVEAKT
jgi:hypothetical protein